MRLIHVSDLKLGNACESFRAEADKRKEELWDTFKEICRACNNRRAGLLLLSGNIFDRQPRFDEMQRLKEMFSLLDNTAVVWIAGTSDPLREKNTYASYPWPENVHIIKGAGRVHLPALGCCVTGVSCMEEEMDADIFSALRPAPSDELQILMMNGDSAQGIRHEKLASFGYDYVALGGRQNFYIWENERCAYAGSPEPLDISGTGKHGYILVNLSDKGTGIEIVDIAKRHFRSAWLYLSRFMSKTEVEKSWRIARGNSPENTSYKLVLKGQRPEGISLKEYEELGDVIAVSDETESGFNIEEIKKAHSKDILGAFIESMEKEDGQTAAKAMEIGIEALLKGASN